MIRMKGIETLIGAALVIVITISAIVLAFQLSNPAVDRTKENLIFQEGKSNLLSMNNYINDVVLEGNGSVRILMMYATDGDYYVLPENDSIQFIMQSKAQIVAAGVSKIEDGINITGYPNQIVLFMNYSNIDIKTGAHFGKGH